MAVTSKQALARPKAAAAARPVAQLHTRVSAYLIDTAVLVGFILLFFIAGGAVLLFNSDLGREDPPDSAYYAFIAIFLAGTLLGWSAFNLAFLGWRGQTAGMYMMRLRAVSEDGGRLSASQALLRWFALHPLLFHPVLLPVWGLASLVTVTITLSQALFVVTMALVLLCIVSPVVALGAMLLDGERRTLSDRLARTLVVHVDRS